MSVAKVQTLFNDLFDSPLNEATIQKCQLTAFDRLEAEENYIKSKLPEQEYQSVILQYQYLLDNGYAEESPPVIAAKKGKPKKTKGRNLLERLDMHWEAVLAFANHTDVPFTNNLAERDIRPAKSKIKVAGCFRTIQGAKAYARIHSFISTVRKHQYNPFNELINIFSGLTPQYRAATT